MRAKVADFDVSLSPFWERRPDSLYHYANGRLNPRFTMNFAKKEIPIHDYKEFPHHFLGSISIEKQLDENNFTTEDPADFIIDKQTLKGAFLLFLSACKLRAEQKQREANDTIIAEPPSGTFQCIYSRYVCI